MRPLQLAVAASLLAGCAGGSHEVAPPGAKGAAASRGADDWRSRLVPCFDGKTLAGWKLVGGILVICGVIDAVLAPRILKREWERAGR